ncbi:solute carrier family 44 protein member 2 [Trypanosoma rangeli]|uniref:Choline transporter-like protein n=1 Tax=Trypanosoma rangeli TaxID=5698 RepID=A0A3R7JZJ5_TRYRA|nr:solute carrier family 44 protein member 2 [Trypanosoma rangeli]RNE97962.1 solute carrier family 44 protein member 2 [Trypanosoma rangeli]|eukprot:RNE97962.1 solute carrier family 44 protein member 2 [Trypanosoma rangeli]
MGGCCCLCENKTTDLPEKYEENRSCTDVLFLIIFIGFLAAFAVLGVVAFKGGDLRLVLFGSDYLGYACGTGVGPANFSSHIPSVAPFQSKNWSENEFLWYPLPIVKHVTDVFQMSSYLNLGLCVKKCPQTNVEGLKELLANNISGPDLPKMQVYSYGDTSKNGGPVSAASRIYAVYDTSSVMRKCLPKIKQPVVVQSNLSSPYLEKAQTFIVQGIDEIANSWRVIGIEAVICIVACFVFIVLIRFCISILVWLIIVCLFLLLAGGGGVAFLLYQTNGNSSYFPVTGVQGYSSLFLVLAIVLWFLAICYLFIVLALCSKIRLVCAIIQIAGRVLGSAPTMVILPFGAAVVIIALLAWSVLVGLCLCSAKERGTAYSLVPVTDALYFEGTPLVDLNNTKFFKVASEVLNSKHSTEYFLIADIFGFFWTMTFINALCFTTIAFVSVFWYFSSLYNAEKSVPTCGVCKGIFWTLFYHTGTLALGSFLIAIIQTIRFVLSYFVRKAQSLVHDTGMIRCMACYLECFIAYFVRVISVINTNAFVMMCLTSHGFCISACRAIQFIMSYTVELIFLTWFINILTFLVELLVVTGCCVSAYFLCKMPELATDIQVFVMPLIVIGVMTLLLSRAFFSVYESAATALLVCYCYDLKVNASRGMYYVPEELEHQISDYSQKEKLRQFNEQQAAVHRMEGE